MRKTIGEVAKMEWLKCEEIAEKCGITAAAVRLAIKEGRLRKVKKSGRAWLISTDDNLVKKWIAGAKKSDLATAADIARLEQELAQVLAQVESLHKELDALKPKRRTTASRRKTPAKPDNAPTGHKKSPQSGQQSQAGA
jgi:hypothetical protein